MPARESVRAVSSSAALMGTIIKVTIAYHDHRRRHRPNSVAAATATTTTTITSSVTITWSSRYWFCWLAALRSPLMRCGMRYLPIVADFHVK